MKKPTKFQAVHNLVGGQLSCSGDVFTYYDGQAPPEEEEIDAELKRMQDEYDAQAYARTRAPLYPELGEQLDMLFHDMTAGKGDKTGEWYKAVAKVKTDNPKPE